MDDKLKKLIERTLLNEIKINFDNNFLGNAEQIISKILKTFGKKNEAVILDVLLNYLNENYSLNNPNAGKTGKKLMTEIVKIFIKIGIDTNLIVNSILENKISVQSLGFPFLLELFEKTKNISFLNGIISIAPKIIDRHEVDKFYISVIRKISNSKKLLNDENYFKIIENIFEQYKLRNGVNQEFFNLYANLIVNKLPPKVSDLVKKQISQLSFTQQIYLWYKTEGMRHSSEIKQFFDKISTMVDKNIIPVGTPHGSKGLIMIESYPKGLFGYVDSNGNLVIPPVFKQLSSVKGSIIKGLIVQQDKENWPIGFYKMDDDGNVLEHSKY